MGAEGEPPDPPTSTVSGGSVERHDGGFVDLTPSVASLMQYDAQTGIDVTLGLMQSSQPVERAIANDGDATSAATDTVIDGSGTTPGTSQFAGQANDVAAVEQGSSAARTSDLLGGSLPESSPSNVNPLAGDPGTTRLFDDDVSRFLDGRGHEFWKLELDRLGVPDDSVPPAEVKPDSAVAESTSDAPADEQMAEDSRPLSDAELADGGAVELLSFERLAATTSVGEGDPNLVTNIAPVTIDARLGFFRSIDLASAGEIRRTVTETLETATRVSPSETPEEPLLEARETDDRVAAWNPRDLARWLSAAVATGVVWALRHPSRSNDENATLQPLKRRRTRRTDC